MADKRGNARNPKGRGGDKLSLWPLNFIQAISGALEVKPEPKKEKKKRQGRKKEVEKDKPSS